MDLRVTVVKYKVRYNLHETLFLETRTNRKGTLSTIHTMNAIIRHQGSMEKSTKFREKRVME